MSREESEDEHSAAAGEEKGPSTPSCADPTDASGKDEDKDSKDEEPGRPEASDSPSQVTNQGDVRTGEDVGLSERHTWRKKEGHVKQGEGRPTGQKDSFNDSQGEEVKDAATNRSTTEAPFEKNAEQPSEKEQKGSSALALYQAMAMQQHEVAAPSSSTSWQGAAGAATFQQERRPYMAATGMPPETPPQHPTWTQGIYPSQQPGAMVAPQNPAAVPTAWTKGMYPSQEPVETAAPQNPSAVPTWTQGMYPGQESAAMVAPQNPAVVPPGAGPGGDPSAEHFEWWSKYYQHYYQLTAYTVMPGMTPAPPPNPWTLQVLPALISQSIGATTGASAATTPTGPQHKKQRVEGSLAENTSYPPEATNPTATDAAQQAFEPPGQQDGPPPQADV